MDTARLARQLRSGAVTEASGKPPADPYVAGVRHDAEPNRGQLFRLRNPNKKPAKLALGGLYFAYLH